MDQAVRQLHVSGPFGDPGDAGRGDGPRPEAIEILHRTGAGVSAVGAALGYSVEPIFGLKPEEFMGTSDEALKKHLVTLLGHVGKAARNSTVQDLMKGRPCEVDFMNGLS